MMSSVFPKPGEGGTLMPPSVSPVPAEKWEMCTYGTYHHLELYSASKQLTQANAKQTFSQPL